MKNKLLVLFTFLSIKLFAQDAPPQTDIYVFDMLVQHGNVQVVSPEMITTGKGYNNQPWFAGDELVYFTTIQEDGQADIMLAGWGGQTLNGIDLVKYHPITISKTLKEYSAQVTPNGQHITCVQVQPDDSTQWLVQMNMDGSNSVRLLPNTNPVGYYCWVDDKNVAAFVLGTPEILVYGNAITGDVKTIASNIGRCITKIPGLDAFSFVDKTDSNDWKIMKYDVATNQITKLIDCAPKSEDYAWTPDGTLLMGSEGKLFSYNSQYDSSWKLVRDFTGTDTEKFYRLMVSADGKKLAMVVYSGQKP